MADEKVLIDVDIQATQALKELVDLRDQVKQLRSEQLKLDQSTEEGREEYEALAEQIKAVNAEARERSKVIQNEIKQQNQATNSLNQMGQRLAAMKKAYRDLSEEERNSAKGKEMLEYMAALNQQLSEAEQAYGVFGRNVGNYQGAINTLFPAFGKLQSALGGITAAGGSTDKTFKGMVSGMKSAGKQAIKFGMQLMATPIGWIAAAVALLVAQFKLLQNAFKKNDDAGTSVQKLMASFKPILDGIGKAIQVVVGWIGKLADGLANLIARFSSSAAAAQDLVTSMDNLQEAERQYTENSARRSRDISELRAKAADKDKYTAEERMKMLEEAIELERQNLADEMAIASEKLRILEETAKNESDTSDETKDKIAAARAELFKAEEKYFAGERSMIRELTRARKESADEEAKQAKEAEESYKRKLKAAYDAASTEAKLRKAFADEDAAMTEAYLDEDFYTRAQWAKKEFDREEQAAKDELALQAKYHQITAEEYNNQLKLLEAKRETFNAQQLAASQKYYTETMENAMQLLDETEKSESDAMAAKYDKQIEMAKEAGNELAERYYAMVAAGVDDETLQEVEAALMENAAVQVALADQKGKNLEEIRNKWQKAAYEGEKKALDETYALDIALAHDNEAAKLEITKDYLAKQAELMKASYGEGSLQYIEAMNALKDFNEETAKNMAEAAQARFEQLASGIEQWANKAMETTNAISDLMKANEERELEQYEEDNERKNKSLEKRLDQGLISQEEYDLQVAESNAELDRKKAEITLKQAKREKALNLMNAAINTATAIMQIWAQVPKFDFGASTIALTAVAAALGAVQMATIAATPLPKAAKGGIAGGGLLVGASHAQGGIPIEAEGGEAIINKRSTAKYRGLLSAINADGGGAKFAHGGIVGEVAALQDGGYAARNAGAAQSFPTAQDIAEACAKMQIYTAVTDINRGQANYAQIVQNAKF